MSSCLNKATPLPSSVNPSVRSSYRCQHTSKNSLRLRQLSKVEIVFTRPSLYYSYLSPESKGATHTGYSNSKVAYVPCMPNGIWLSNPILLWCHQSSSWCSLQTSWAKYPHVHEFFSTLSDLPRRTTPTIGGSSRVPMTVPGDVNFLDKYPDLKLIHNLILHKGQIWLPRG